MRSDTWGIPSQTFLLWYLVGAAVAVALSLTLRMRARESPGRATRPLTPPEVGALTSDFQAILASVTILRSAEMITIGGKFKRALFAQDMQHLDWFTRTVHEQLGKGAVPLHRVRLVKRLNIPLVQLRSTLMDEGYLQRPQSGVDAAMRIAPIAAVIAVGSIRLVAGIASGHPVGFLLAILAVLVALTIYVRRDTRRTRFGDAELERLKQENSFLSPNLNPSFSSYGPSFAGLSAALFGTGALVLIDPSLASAVSASPGAGTGGGGSSSGSDSGSGSGGSSCGSSDSGGGSSGCGG
ncbi:TIGR04222 domain-containing membrane protein [Rhodococcus sp. ARC_M6]|uniref:TIGR04222 domain-containing membrane protein n=1 Tax=Rhodococcus sp. ARC_M6 TaxID=2928852 RepID=UPI001FB36F4E|nr:TIGR04222 domain-containing membrane protein [Rhodococcus sp. ARC_M6]MCJ0905569.1 TIGR04222 domain-containing membrane protein [Rhodococcus sp. ARC_M6]